MSNERDPDESGVKAERYYRFLDMTPDAVVDAHHLDVLTKILADPKVAEVQTDPAVLCASAGRVDRRHVHFVASLYAGGRTPVVVESQEHSAATRQRRRLDRAAAWLPTSVADQSS